MLAKGFDEYSPALGISAAKTLIAKALSDNGFSYSYRADLGQFFAAMTRAGALINPQFLPENLAQNDSHSIMIYREARARFVH